MKQAHKISTIFKEFSKKYPRYFIYLLLLLVIESIFAAGSILAIIPLADFMLDPSLTSPGKITTIAIQIFSSINIDVGFWTFGLFFVAFNLFNYLQDILALTVGVNRPSLPSQFFLLYNFLHSNK